MTPVTISRKGYGYHDTSLAPEGFSSATGIRKALHENPDILTKGESSLIQVPDSVKQMMAKGFPVFPDDLSALLNTTLLKLDYEGIPFEKYADVSEELAARLLRQLPDFFSFEEKKSTT